MTKEEIDAVIEKTERIKNDPTPQIRYDADDIGRLFAMAIPGTTFNEQTHRFEANGVDVDAFLDSKIEQIRRTRDGIS